MSDLHPIYVDGCAAGELRLQQCQACSRFRFPDSSLCPHCLSSNAEWVAASGRGTVRSWIRMHQRYFANLHRETPYNVALIDLAEGPTMISAFTDEAAVPSIGAPVTAVFRELGGDVLPFFELDGAPA